MARGRRFENTAAFRTAGAGVDVLEGAMECYSGRVLRNAVAE